MGCSSHLDGREDGKGGSLGHVVCGCALVRINYMCCEVLVELLMSGQAMERLEVEEEVLLHLALIKSESVYDICPSSLGNDSQTDNRLDLKLLVVRQPVKVVSQSSHKSINITKITANQKASNAECKPARHHCRRVKVVLTR